MSRLKVNKVDHFIETYIFDAEADAVECGFLNDGCVELNTSSVKWIKLSTDNLFELIELIDEAEEAFKTTEDDL
tara:strand:- start:2135 stop:2356 length:222 start_codon:yes stop_codon:yes gene_type:complete